MKIQLSLYLYLVSLLLLPQNAVEGKIKKKIKIYFYLLKESNVIIAE